MRAYFLGGDSPFGHTLTGTGCLFYAHYVREYIPWLLEEPAGLPMGYEYLQRAQPDMAIPPWYSNFLNIREVKDLFGLRGHTDPIE